MAGDAPAIGEKELHPQAQRILSAYIQRFRYSTLGSLLHGVLHNLNGALQVLSMQVELLERMAAREGENVSEEIQSQIAKCSEQVAQFQIILNVLLQKEIHDEENEEQMFSLNELLEEELSVLRHNLFFKHRIQIRKAFAPSLPLLKGHRTHFSQAFDALIANAIEAMSDSERKELSLVTSVDDGRIRVEIKDTGCGISKEVEGGLFRPFFTTKGGNHHGLGLVAARMLLEPYGASFRFSCDGKETVFEVSLPCQSSDSSPR